MTPATAVTAAVTSRLMVSLSGHPATVEQHVDGDGAVLGDVHRVDHPELGDGALDLGVVDGREGVHDLLLRGGAHDG